jgi:hypothetical protein
LCDTNYISIQIKLIILNIQEIIQNKIKKLKLNFFFFYEYKAKQNLSLNI